MTTLKEIQDDIQSIIKNNKSMYDLQNALLTAGYPVSYQWVKGGEVGNTFYLKRKRLYRIQVTPSELHGQYYKAWCVEIFEPALQEDRLYANDRVFIKAV